MPFLDAHGKPEHYVSIRFEITEQKLIQEQLRMYSQELEKKNQGLREFTSIAAHELQEPLRKIQAFSNRLLKRLPQEQGGNLSDDSQDDFNRLIKSATRMRKLIDELLAYSQVTLQTQPFLPTALKPLIEEALGELDVSIENTQAQIQIVSPLPTLKVDPIQFRQLFVNLIGNALKFRKPNTAPHIQISAIQTETHWTLAVEDRGIGFDEIYLDQIFKLFHRIHGKEAYAGTGIGLAICSEIVARHGGTLTAKSKPQEGSTFLIYLPLSLACDHGNASPR